MKDYKLIVSLDGHRDAVTSLTLDGNFLFSGGEDGTIRIWNLAKIADAYQLSIIEAHSRSVRDSLIIPDLGYLITCSFDGTVKVWDYSFDAETGKCGKLLKQYSYSDEFRCVTYRPSRRDFICGTQNSRILVFALSPELLQKEKN